MYESPDFRIYAVDIDREKYPQLKLSKFGNVVVKGNIHSLADGQKYEFTVIEQHDSKGYFYKILNVKRDRPTSELDTLIFLNEILTPAQANTLYEAYPDIVDRIINNRLDGVDLNKTKGIKEFTFTLIKQKVIENFCLVELVSEFHGLLSLPMLKKLYEYYPSVQVIKNKMKSAPYTCLCNLSGVGFKTADTLLLEIDQQSKENVKNGKPPIIDFEFDLKTSSQRCMECIKYLLDENQNDGHTKMNLVKLKNQCDKMVPACSHYFVECVKSDDFHYDIEKREIGLKSTYDTEKYIAERILEALEISKNSSMKWNFDTGVYRNVGGVSATDEQMGALKQLCDSQISILNGSAGVGKSQTVSMVIQMLIGNNKSFELFSPTGKAAKNLADYAKQPASTIHRGLGYMPPSTWRVNQENKLNCDVLIIDEISMCDIFLFKRVLDALDFNRTKLMLIGDSAQLPSVSCGNLLHDFIQSNVVPTTTLTKVFRYGEGGLMKVATDVRRSKKYLDEKSKKQITFFGENKDYAFINVGSSQIIKSTVELYKKLISQGYNPDDIQVLSAQNKGEYGSVNLNNHLQKAANPNSATDEGIKVGETTFYVGDIVIQTVNNYDAKIYMEDCFIDDEDMPTAFIANGESGRIVMIAKHNMVIDFDGVKVIYSRDELQGISLGFCISTHKSQGGGFRIVILLTPQAHTYMLNSNLIYVGLTRMKEKCFHLGNPHTVNVAIKKKENFNRETFLGDLLKAV